MSEHECPTCGREFDSQRALSVHRTRSHDSPWRDRETLERLYNEEGLTQQEIADKFNVGRNAIWQAMSTHGIETDWSGDPTGPVSHTFFNPSDRGVGYEYEWVRTRIDDKIATMGVHRLVAYADGKLDGDEIFDTGVVVHHESRHGLDNRPDNLEVMTNAEHMSHHMQLRQVGKT